MTVAASEKLLVLIKNERKLCTDYFGTRKLKVVCVRDRFLTEVKRNVPKIREFDVFPLRGEKKVRGCISDGLFTLF